MIKYFNIRSSHGTETIDQLDSNDFKTSKDFQAEVKRLLDEYHLAWIPCYTSQKCTLDWSK